MKAIVWEREEKVEEALVVTLEVDSWSVFAPSEVTFFYSEGKNSLAHVISSLFDPLIYKKWFW